jgi:hypothetical protein
MVADLTLFAYEAYIESEKPKLRDYAVQVALYAADDAIGPI